MCSLEVTLGAGAKVIGEKIFEEGLRQAGKAALKQLLAGLDKEKDPVFFFGLFCSFKELPSFDVASSQFNTILESMSVKGQEVVYDKHTFKHSLSWEEFEGCEIPDNSWELDTYLIEVEDQESIDQSLASTCVSGFTFWLFPLSQGNKERIVPSAYRILDGIRNKLYENQRLNIRRAAIFAFIRADFSMCSRIEKKLRKKMHVQQLPGNLYVERVTNERMLLTVPLREMVYALALAGSLKRWRFI